MVSNISKSIISDYKNRKKETTALMVIIAKNTIMLTNGRLATVYNIIIILQIVANVCPQ